MMVNESKTYQWTGINTKGRRVNGVLTVNDMAEAQLELKKMGIEVINIQTKKNLLDFKIKGFSRQKKIKPNDILLFTRYLSTMMAAGLPIIQALEIISDDKENQAIQSMVRSIKTNVAGGKTLAESFSQYPNQFSDLYCSLIKAGEKSGTLDKILNRLAVYLEKTETLKRKIKKALIYPIAILVVAFAVSLILLLFVVPQFQAMFKSFGADLPVFTQMVVGLSDFMRSYWYIIIAVLALLIVGLRHFIKTSDSAKELIDKWILKIYIIGPILQKGIIARYTRTLATTIEAGMPIVESMKSMSPVMGNRIYTRAVNQICDDIVSGHQLSDSMSSTKLFPNMVIQMISVGEASGSLAEMLNQVASYYEEEVANIVDNLSSLIEPLIMVVLGVVIGGFVIAMYLPIFRIGSLF